MKRFTAIITFILMLSFFANAIEPITVDAESALLIEPESGQILYEKNPDEKRYPASITKLMTALIVAEENDLSATVTANKTAFEGLSAAGSTLGIKPGEEMSVDNLLICLLVASANESANILAEHNAGSVSAFVEKMNARAEALGCKNTHFANAHGLHDEDHYTCASDVILIAKAAMAIPRLREIVAMQRATIPPTNIGEEKYFFSTNSMLSPFKERTYLYKYTTGIKTGHTTPAGLCLVASATKGENSLLSVVLGAKYGEKKEKGHFIETTKLFKWGFENFKSKTVLAKTTPITELQVRLAWDRDHLIATSKNDFICLVPTDYDEEKLEVKHDLPTSIDAPIEKGQKLGTATLIYDGKELGTTEIVAADSVRRSIILFVWDFLTRMLGTTVAKIVLILIAAFIVFYLFYVVRYNRNRRRNRYRGRYRKR